MLKIAICDDEYYFREQIQKYIAKYLVQQQVLFEIKEFSSGKEFLEYSEKIQTFQIVFLDINMEDVDGIEVGKAIRRQSSNTIIIYVTAYIDYSLEGYKVDALRYLLKSSKNLQMDLEECMETAIKRVNYIPKYKEFSFREGKKNIPVEEVVYIESNLHLLEFYFKGLAKRKYTMYGTLNMLEAQLSDCHFVRIHQSFLVNMEFVEMIGKEKVFLSNGVELPLARGRRKEAEQTFTVFKGEV